MQLFVRINIEPEFEKSLYEEAPANIQGRETQHHDSNDLQMMTPPQRKCPGGGIIGLGDKWHENGPTRSIYIPAPLIKLPSWVIVMYG